MRGSSSTNELTDKHEEDDEKAKRSLVTLSEKKETHESSSDVGDEEDGKSTE